MFVVLFIIFVREHMGKYMKPLLNIIKNYSKWKMLKKRDDRRRKQNTRKYVRKVEAGLFTKQLKSVANTDTNIVDEKK